MYLTAYFFRTGWMSSCSALTYLPIYLLPHRVDELVFDTPYSMTMPFLDSMDCDFCVHGDDMAINADGTDAYAEAKAANRIKVRPPPVTDSLPAYRSLTTHW